MRSVAPGQPLIEALEGLRSRLDSASLRLDVPDVDTARRGRDDLVAQIDDYLLPRLRHLGAPMLAVVGGSTGAGKSTLVNSLVGAEVSPAGVIRPTTRAPVLVCHPSELGWFSDDRILPGLARTTGSLAAGVESRGLHLVTDADVPSGLALLDAPDVDSVVTENRELAGQLLGAADLWLFVTTAARYADAVPWDLLHVAHSRGTAMAVVLNRVPAEARDEVPAHLRSMLRREGLERAPLLVVPETELVEELIPPSALAPVRRWLDELGADAEARQRLVRTTLDGALHSLVPRVSEVAAHVEAQVGAAGALGAEVERAYAHARHEVLEGLAGGTLLRGEVLARWQEVVGTGEVMRSLEARIGRMRDRVRQALSGRPAPALEVQVALGDSLETLVVSAADRAAERAVDAWQGTDAGWTVLARDPVGPAGRLARRPASRLARPLGTSAASHSAGPPVSQAVGRPAGEEQALNRASAGLAASATAEIREWQGHVLELVAAEGASKRATARALSLGVNGAGAVLMVGLFAQTGGLTGGELAVAGGTATVSQKVLEAVFGDQAVRTLTARARDDLLRRVDRLLAAEADRFHRRLQPFVPQPGQADGLRAAVTVVQEAR